MNWEFGYLKFIIFGKLIICDKLQKLSRSNFSLIVSFQVSTGQNKCVCSFDSARHCSKTSWIFVAPCMSDAGIYRVHEWCWDLFRAWVTLGSIPCMSDAGIYPVHEWCWDLSRARVMLGSIPCMSDAGFYPVHEWCWVLYRAWVMLGSIPCISDAVFYLLH